MNRGPIFQFWKKKEKRVGGNEILMGSEVTGVKSANQNAVPNHGNLVKLFQLEGFEDDSLIHRFHFPAQMYVQYVRFSHPATDAKE